MSVDQLVPNQNNPSGAVYSAEENARTKESSEKNEHQSLEERVRFQARILDAVGQAIIATDLQGRVIYWNRAAESFYGWSAEEVMGRSILEVTPSQELMEQAQEIMAELGAGKSWSGEFTVRRKDGSTFPAMVIDTPVQDEQGNLVAIVGVSMDITDLKKVEELRQSEERFRLLVERVRDYAIFMLDTEGCISSWNTGAERINGYTSEEILGRHFSCFYTEEDVEQGHPEEELRLARERGRYEEEGWRIRKDGSRFWASVLITALWDQDGGLRGFSKVVRDITERKEAEEEKSRQASYAAFRADVSAALAEGGDLTSILQRCVECMVRHLDAAFARIWTLNEEEDLLELKASAGIYTHLDGPHSQIPVGEFKIGLVAQERRPHLTNNVLGDPRISDMEWVEAEGIVAFAGHPLVVENKLVGVTAMFAREPLKEDTIEALASIADIVAHGIKRKRDEEELKSSEEFFRALYEDVHYPIFLLDKDLNFVDVNPFACEFYGYSSQEFRQMRLADITLPEERADQQEHLERIHRQGETFVQERRHRRKSGEIVIVTADVVTVWRTNKELYVSKITDITERVWAEERLQHQAFHDLLTDLPNRQLFIDRLTHALRRTGRHQEGKVAVFFLDLDNFKVINDSLGHGAGDRLLVAVGERLKGSLRPEDTLARFGGDEFTLLVEDIGDPSEAVRVAERVVESLRDPFSMDGRELFVTASIGIALGDYPTVRAEELLRSADTAMYRAKKGGALKYEVFDQSMYKEILERLELENDLRRAPENEELKLYYQPKIRLAQPETITGFEALLRWEHPRRGLVMPSLSIPLAEETGLIFPIGRWTLGEACRQAKEWQERYPNEGPPLDICVNIFSQQIRHPNLIEQVSAVLRESGLEASCLTLEITEGMLLEDTKMVEYVLGELKALGVRLAIDDFGTVYSSLAYLKRLPVDILKIDRSFVAELGKDKEGTAIVRMIVELAHTLGIEVVAEGVESEEQLVLLTAMGCDCAQGFYLSEGLPPEAASKYLSR